MDNLPRQLRISQKDGKPPELKADKRFVEKAPNLKHLRYSRKLPLRCNDCRYRPKEKGGTIGGCTAYKEDSLCRIRSDTRKIIEKYEKDNPDEVLPLLQEEFNANYEKLKFFETMENMTGTLNPEVTKRINALTKTAKIIHEFKLKKTSIEMSEKKVLTDDQKTEIARIIRMSMEEVDDTQ